MSKYKRKDFIKLMALGAAGLYLTGCDFGSEEKKQKSEKDTTADSPKTIKTKNVVYYKKGDPKYEELRQGFNKRIQKFPAIIALCLNTEGVADAIQYAKENNLPVSVKSGGHCFEGFSSNNGGLVINLKQLSTIEWLDENNIQVGPACPLALVYEQLIPKGKIIPAGSCGTVGVGGLTLGGGYGLFSRDMGLTCDRLTAFTFVDGYGNIRSSKDDSELLWACRGGGNGNFGIVTEMKFRLHPAPESFTSHRFKALKLDAEKAISLLENWFTITKELPTTCFSAFVLNGRTLNILLTNHGKHTDSIQKIMDNLSSITEKTTIGKPRPLGEALQNYYGIQHPIYFKNASAGLYKSFEDVKTVIRQVCEIVTTTPGMIYQVNTLGGKIMDTEFEAASSYPHRSYPYLSELQTYWEEPRQEQKLTDAFQQVQELLAGNGINTQYRNYPDINFKDPLKLYYGSSRERLLAVKKKYDPDNLIRHEQSVQNA